MRFSHILIKISCKKFAVSCVICKHLWLAFFTCGLIIFTCGKHDLSLQGRCDRECCWLSEPTLMDTMWLSKSQLHPNCMLAAAQVVCWRRCSAACRQDVGWDTEVFCMWNKQRWGTGGPALLTSESSLHGTGRGQVHHDAHHLFPSEHTLTKTCSMEGHLQLQAVSAPPCINWVPEITLCLGGCVVIKGGSN